MKWLLTLSGIAVMLGMTGCGSSNGDPSHGVAADKQLSALASDEVVGICEAAHFKLWRMRDTGAVCAMSAMTYTQTFDECSELVAACVLDSELEQIQRERMDLSCPESEQEEYAECDLRVQDLDACLRAKLRKEAIVDGIESCTEMHEDSAPEDSGQYPADPDAPPEECTELQSQCEAVYDLLSCPTGAWRISTSSC